MVYQYVAYKESGEIVKGKLSAANEEAATNLLDYAGYRVIHLKPFATFLGSDRLSVSLVRVKPAEVILFYRQLALLLESGIDIIASLELLQDQVSNRSLKRVLGEVISNLRNGSQLSAALSKHSRIFQPIYCQSLRVAEQTGGLETMLRQMADYMEKEAVTGKSIKKALTYPIIVSVVAVVVISILAIFVLPAFTNLYSSLGADLPPLTKLVIDAADKLRSYGVYIMLAVFIAAGLAFTYIKTSEGKYKWDKLALRLPLTGRVNHLNSLARQCRSMSLLFRAGLPLTEILSLIIQSSDNKVMAKALIDVQQDMFKGEGLSQPMAKNALFLPMMVQMIKIGEETGNLDTTLLAVAQSYETEAEDKTNSFIGLIQPTMTLIIALVVAGIALSMVSAMYSVYGQAF